MSNLYWKRKKYEGGVSMTAQKEKKVVVSVKDKHDSLSVYLSLKHKLTQNPSSSCGGCGSDGG